MYGQCFVVIESKHAAGTRRNTESNTGEGLGQWHGDGAPKIVVGTPDTKYGTSSRELEGVDSVVVAKLANALSPSTGWSPPVAAPVEFFQKEEIIVMGS